MPWWRYSCQTKSVPERCTCGAVLPEDALFCHRCGKPQRELVTPVAEPEPVSVAPPPPIPAPVIPRIGFSNGPAVRIALLAGILSIVAVGVAGQLATLWLIAPLCPLAAGFLAVFLYRRRTGERLSARSGAQLGWISGLFGFVIITVMLTMMAVALTEPSTVASLREQWHQYGRAEADLNQMIDALRNPLNIISYLATSFLLFTVLTAFGGAIGAKLLDRD
jgi:hypothetical protein